jgi:hypothetical protein
VPPERDLPVLCTGAPRANSTFFCDSQSVYCWALVETNMTQVMASGACSNMGGAMVTYPVPEKQRLVEVGEGAVP